MRKLSTFLLLLGLTLQTTFNSVFCQPNLQHLEYFDKKDGLSGTKVTDILQGRKGFLWLTTTNGLDRYDGSEFLSFSPYPEGESQKSIFMHRVIPHGRNQLLLATNDGLFLFNTQDYTFRRIDFSDVIKSRSDSGFTKYLNIIARLEKDSCGNIWAGTPISLYRLDSALRLRKFFWSDYEQKDLYSRRLNYVLKILPLNKKLLLVWIDNKTQVWNGSEDTFIPVENWADGRLAFLKDIRYTDCFGFKDRYLIYFRRNVDSLFIYDVLTGGKASCYFQYMNDRDYDWQQVISVLSDEWLALSLENDALTLIHVSNKNNRLSVKYFPERIFPEYNLGKIITDSEGNLWATGKKGGLFKVAFQKQKFSITDLPEPKIPNHAFRISCFLRKGDKVFVGMYGEGLFEWDPVSGKISHRLNRSGSNIARSNIFWNLRNGKGDTVWVGTQSGLFWYNTEKKTFGCIPEHHPEELDAVPITTQFTDSHGDVWIGLGMGNGVVRYETSSDTYTHFRNSAGEYPYRYPVAIAEDSKSDIWFLSDNSTNLVKWDRKNKRFIIVPLNIPQFIDKISWSVLLIDHEDNAWLGTESLGLICYSLTNHSYKLMKKENGSNIDFLSGLYLDEEKKIWAISNSELYYFDKDINRFVSYSFEPDARIMEKSGPFYYDSVSQKLYTSLFRKIISFNPQSLKRTRPAMDIILTGLKVMDKKIPVPPNREIHLKPDQNDITLSFSGINLSDGKQNQYSYRFKGGNWINIGSQRQVRLASLSPGTYDIVIRAARSNEDWSPETESLRIVIAPPFTSTIWFILICLLLSGALIYLWYRYRLNQMLKVQKIRTNISQDLHDELGSKLTSIGYLSLIAKDKSEANPQLSEVLQKINESSVEASSSMREIIWDINPDLDSLNLLIPRLIQNAASILELRGITLHSQADTIPASAKLDLYKRRDFKMIFMESVNNIVKHSGAGQAWIRVQYVKKMIYLTIKDNGKGFDTVKSDRGNGLKNISARAAAHKWNLSYISAEGEGTTLKVTFRIT